MKDEFLSVNYHYHLSSAIFNLLKFGSPEFSSFLHNIGYKHYGRTYKLFSFALRFEKIQIIGNMIKSISPYSSLFITSPLIEDFIKNFVIGTFESQTILIQDRNEVAEFSVTQMEMLPEPDIKDEMHFMLLSPMVLSTKRIYKGKEQQYFLRPDDTEEINRILTQNLKNKYAIIHNKTIDNGELKLEWDYNYLKKHNRVTKKITINKNGRYPVDVIGIQAPFKLTGNPELIKVGYQCGFGEKNSMGFGMAQYIY